MAPSTVRYGSRRLEQTELRGPPQELAAEHRRWGYPWLHALLEGEGWQLNHKRFRRLYGEEGLQVRRRRRKRGSRPRRPVTVPSGPNVLVCDNGPEFSGQAMDAWAYRRGVKIQFIRPGKPVENCFIKSMGGSLRDECLNEYWFTNLPDARRTMKQWRRDYNRVPPHSSLANFTPKEFVAQDESATGE